MRHATMAFAAIALLASAAAAQTPDRQSAVGTELRDYGGFIGLDTRFGDMMDEFAVFMGGHAALLLKHRVYLGVGGAALVTDHSTASADQTLDMGYGGLLVGYVVPVPALVQVTAEVMIGAGGARLAEREDIGAEEEDEEWDALFVFEPALGAEIKLARIVRLGFGASYRFVGATDTPGIGDSDLRGLTGTATLRLGWF